MLDPDSPQSKVAPKTPPSEERAILDTAARQSGELAATNLVGENGEVVRFDPIEHEFVPVNLRHFKEGVQLEINDSKVDEVLATLLNPQIINSDSLVHLTPQEAASISWFLDALRNNEWLRNFCGSAIVFPFDDNSVHFGTPEYMQQNADLLLKMAEHFLPENRPEQGTLTKWMEETAYYIRKVLPKAFSALTSHARMSGKLGGEHSWNDLLGEIPLLEPLQQSESESEVYIMMSRAISAMEAGAHAGLDGQAASALAQFSIRRGLEDQDFIADERAGKNENLIAQNKPEVESDSKE